MTSATASTADLPLPKALQAASLPQPEPAQLSRRFARRAARWLMVALACAFAATIARLGEVTHDAFHEMALFRHYVSSGSFPIDDVFAYTPTVSPSVHHEWGTGAILYLVTVGTGWELAGLTVLKALLIATMWLILYRVAKLRGVHPYLFALFSAVVFPMLWVGFATIRATLFTLLFLSLQLWMHEQDRRGRRLWLIAWWCMLVAWLNMHAGFVVGIGFLGLHACERFVATWFRSRSLMMAWKSTWHLVLAGPLAIIALPINPYGWQYVPYLVKAISMPRPKIAEWLPLWHTHQPLFTLAMFSLSLACTAVAVRNKRTSQVLGLLGLSVCGLLALKHLRHGAIYAIVWIAYVPAWLTHTTFGHEIVTWIRGRACSVIGAAQLCSAAMLVWISMHGFGMTTLTGDAQRQLACYPIDAVKYLQQQSFGGNLLTPFHAGAYVSWQMAPHVKVSLDGRYEVAYAPHVFDEHWDFFQGEPGWANLLDKYPHDAVMINQSAKVRPMLEIFREPATTADLPTRERWKLVYEDDAYIILARPTSGLTYRDLRR